MAFSAARARTGGFCMMEMVTVVSVIGVLAGLAAVYFGTLPDELRERAAAGERLVVRAALDAFHHRHGRWPATPRELADSGLAEVPAWVRRQDDGSPSPLGPGGEGFGPSGGVAWRWVRDDRAPHGLVDVAWAAERGGAR